MFYCYRYNINLMSMKSTFYITYSLFYLLSLFPLGVLYRISDILFILLYYIIRYRRRIIRRNLSMSLSEKEHLELKVIERKFYAFFCDYIVETIKLFSISDKEIARRMQFEGVEDMVKALHEEDKQFAFIYLAHYGNWEWVASLASRIYECDPKVISGQVYHPLHNKVFDNIFLKIRHRFGGDNIAMKQVLRHVIHQRNDGKKSIIGFISDQAPKPNSIHHWTDFFKWETPFFIGTERIGKQVDALIFYGEVERIKRGYYKCKITRMVDDIQRYEDFEVTDIYAHKLENQIKTCPPYWLWTHNRWKRMRERVDSCTDYY